jgi:hypothetical protein
MRADTGAGSQNTQSEVALSSAQRCISGIILERYPAGPVRVSCREDTLTASNPSDAGAGFAMLSA